MTVAIDIRDLIRQPGSSRPLRLQEHVDGLATELAEVPPETPVEGELLLESVLEGVLVSGELSAVMAMSCARCLRPVRQHFAFPVQELFVAGNPDPEDTYPIREGQIDLEPMIRDSIVPAMPFAPLCRPDCLGLCDRCGGDRNLGECSCPPPAEGPWAAWGGLQLPGGASTQGPGGLSS